MIDDKTLSRYKYFLNGLTDGQALLALEDVIKSGLSPEILESAQVKLYHGNEKTLKERLGRTRWAGLSLLQSYRLIEFPYNNQKGNVIRYRYKLLPPAPGKGGEVVKYLQADGTPPLPYILPQMWDIQKKPSKPIWFTEGEKKTLSLLQRGRNCIGIPGVWAFRDKDGKYDVQSRELWSDIRLFHWAGRRTYLGFDSDYKDNPSVRNALYLLSFTLKILKADIRFCSWEGAKGIDDIIYLHRTGDAEKILTEIEEKSVTLEDFVSESHLNEIMYALTEIVSASDSIIEPENLVSIVSNKLKLRRDKVWKEIRHREHKKKQNESSPADKKTITALDPYRIKDDGSVVVVKEINGKETTQRLANFTARIAQEIFEDNGLEDPAMRFVIVGGNKARQFPKIKLSSNKFSNLSWPLDFWGNDARLEVGTNTKDHFRFFVQLYSDLQGVEKKTIFTHTGWRLLNQEWVYLCANGAIGGEGVEVELPGEFKKMGRYCLPMKPENEIEAIRTSLSFLDIGSEVKNGDGQMERKKEITYPTYFYTFLAPLTSILNPMPNFSAYFYGETGSFKSTVATLLCCHFGDFSISNLSNFESSGNAIEKRAFTLKDTLYIIDDLRPSGHKKDALTKEAIALRLIYSCSNRTGRERSNPDMTDKGKYTPRGMLLITGEELVQITSSLARIMVIEFNAGDIDVTRLSDLQKKSGLLPHAMSSFILWVRDNMDMVQASFTSAFPELRTETNRDFSGAHLKFSEQFVFLRFTLDLVMTWARQKGAITHTEAETIIDTAKKVFRTISLQEAERTSDTDAVKQFLTKASDLFSQGLIRLDEIHGRPSSRDIYACSEDNKGKKKGIEWWPDGNNAGMLVGYFDDHNFYFIPSALWEQVKYQYSRINEYFPFSTNTLYKMLEKKGYIETENGRHTVPVKVAGCNKRLLKVKRTTFISSIWDPNAQPTKDDVNA